jgi:hypothetical protein
MRVPVTETDMPAPLTASRLARWTLAAFVLTFLLARIVVLLIMTRRIPDLFLHVGQTHVHHLNYGIFLLVAVGAWLLFAPPTGNGRAREGAALVYGIGLALTFDEFGMWLHLGGSYWQRASYDAVVTLAALLGLLAVAPSLRHARPRHMALAVAILATLAACAALAADYLQKEGSTLNHIERDSPP